MTSLLVPQRSAIVLIGASGSGKSTFARRHFLRTQVISSDECRALVSDDENDQNASADAFALVYFLAELRLARGKLTVVDSTAVEPSSRAKLLEIAGKRGFRKIAVVFDIPESLCVTRDAERGRSVGPAIIAAQKAQLSECLSSIRNEGWDQIITITPDIQETIRLAIA
jgi:protein phosphatase